MKKIWFHKYEVLRLLGQGGTGKVYLVRDMHLNRLAAVKESRDSFLQSETAILKKLDHPGLPGIYDCFKQGDSTFLVMEYIEGMTLRQYLDKHGKVTERQAVRWMMELCGILGYLHGRSPKVIYWDLKPENIMIRQDGRLKLIDLGTAV
ncbi:MAG: serine/threonine protein kinase, partial [Lachnospiraceae bacterium]|nr:serine/threonine protein kinase [Lachnospiraceae bacterium]